MTLRTSVMTLRTMVVGLCLVGMVGCAGPPGYRHGAGDGMAGHTSLERGKQEMAGLIDKTIKDPSKAQRVKALSEQIMSEAVSSTQRSRASHEQLYALNMRYDATRDEFAKILEDLHQNRMSSAARILALRFEMKDALTAEEWSALTTAMNEYRGKYHHGRGAATGASGGY